jgi:hypothetical protein
MYEYLKEQIYVDLLGGLVFVWFVGTVCFYAGIAYALALGDYE